MHDRGALLRRDAPGQLVAHPLHQAAVVDALHLHLGVLAAPPLELALDVAVVPSQVAQSHRVGVDVVQRGQGVAMWPPTARRVASSKAFSASGALRRMWPSTNSMTKKGRSLTASSVHRPMVVGTGMPAGPERVHEAVLAHHVVRRGQHVVERRPAQDPGPPVGVLDPEGQVGAPAGDQGERQRGGDLGDVAAIHSVTFST